MSQDRIQLPGFGRPLHLNHALNKKLFPTALDKADNCSPLTTAREFTMMNLMNSLTDKPEWDKKILDLEIASRWKAEALATPDVDITEAMVEYCIAELQFKSQLMHQHNAVSVFHGDVVKSDTNVPEAYRIALVHAVKPLEEVPEQYRDWHPRSDDKVLDLVHPSLFPLLYGRSRVLPKGRTTLDDCIERCGQGEVVPKPDAPTSTVRYHTHKPFSDQFQWLPCDVDISNGGTKITSYINNLHPHQHKELYELIEQAISYAIPLWNMTLSPHLGGYNMRIKYNACVYDPDPESWPETEGPQQLEGEDDGDFWERRHDWYVQTRQVVLPEPQKFNPFPWKFHVDLRKEYEKSGLQVIVKLANIVLTPEKPNYEGGSWHVEGQLNERICATALYYYDSENITANHLAFRQRSNPQHADNVHYLQGHDDWLTEVFGCRNWSPTIQNIGQVETKQGRMITFPNILQHQVQPFQLADPTKPGHRKILALFLVDPHVKIISTANVPCQRFDWFKEAVQSWPDHVQRARLPVELQDHILHDSVRDTEAFPLTLKEAKELRLNLMDERSLFTTSQDRVFSSQQFALCEH